MKLLTLVAALAAFACSKKDSPAPDPKPVDPAVAAPKPPEPKPEPVMPDPNAAAAAGCTVQVKVSADKVSYDGGGVKGEVAYKHGEAIDLSALKPAAAKCDANVWADDQVTYQDVITTMDAISKAGITNVALGSPTDKPTVHPKPAASSPPLGWTMTTTTTADGKLQISGRMDPNAAKDKLKKVPVIILTKTDAMISGKTVGKVTDSDLDLKIAKVLPGTPADPTIILQADSGLPFSTISAAVKAAQASGYDNVLFAVKNK